MIFSSCMLLLVHHIYNISPNEDDSIKYYESTVYIYNTLAIL